MSDIGAFEADLRKMCGYFVLLSARNKKAEGQVSIEIGAGISFVEVCSNLQQASRSRREINLDFRDDFFLVIQREGNALVSQHELSHWLQPGDMVLVDSLEPSEFTFFGEFNKLCFVMLPRGDVLGKALGGSVVGGNFLPRLDPINGAISAMLQKMRQTTSSENGLDSLLRDALLSVLTIMLRETPDREQEYKSPAGNGMDHALRISRQYINSRYRDPDFKIREMADTLRLSMRQVQRSFASLGTTPTKYLLIKRLEHARKEIDQIIAGRRVELISTIAFEAGFSDLSYFQRTFRRAFGNTPRDYLSGIAERVHIDLDASLNHDGSGSVKVTLVA
ncbi:helix-turn-helix domain-containing protein (plasmid) [Rhizobium sp. CB3171]|uniref:helix-turn-helix domain-containing protein n=1 Tax=Rhizobium sp. CB3171 TaxID=3039157 RepID=UPI0024B07736|nr:helix-turn-helix domain-containing protein [Rhizobium sp. CB3171]WFU05320.1 helix-turn-helix domain-containing protein [Rhizobium sp. CB3171]